MAFIQIAENDIAVWLELKDNPDTYKSFENYLFLLKARIIVENQEDDLNVYLADVLKNRYNPTDMALSCRLEAVISDASIAMSRTVR